MFTYLRKKALIRKDVVTNFVTTTIGEMTIMNLSIKIYCLESPTRNRCGMLSALDENSTTGEVEYHSFQKLLMKEQLVMTQEGH